MKQVLEVEICDCKIMKDKIFRFYYNKTLFDKLTKNGNLKSYKWLNWRNYTEKLYKYKSKTEYSS